MTPALLSVMSLLGVVIVLFARNHPRMDAVAVMVLCVLPLTGVLTMTESLAGFSDPNVVLIAALFVLGEGLVRTGVARQLGDGLAHHAGRSEPRLIALLMAAVCSLGAMMSSTAVTAIFIPVALRIGRRTGMAPGQLMMPLSMAALISGMTTLVATAPNLVVNSELVREGHRPFQFFSFTPFGVPILGLGIVYMLLVRRWLPTSFEESETPATRPTLSEWVERYDLTRREHRLRIRWDSELVGRTLESLQLRGSEGASLVAIQRGSRLVQPTAKTDLHGGDILFVDLFQPGQEIRALCEKYGLELLPLSGSHFVDCSQEIGMAEMFVPADSTLVGKTAVEAGLRTRFGLSLIGLRRGRQAIAEDVGQEKLQIGDTLLVIGPWKHIRNVAVVAANDLVALNLPAEFDELLPAAGKAPAALVVLLLVVGLMISGLLPNVQAALIGCLLMGAFGCVDFESAYRSIDWKTIVLIVGMLPFSMALQRTGGVELASEWLMATTQGLGLRGVLAALFLMTAVLGLFISNTATAVLMAPIALQTAQHLNASPAPFAMIVALAASAAFMTPVSSPVNTLVVTPGNYRFGDFVRIGVPFTAIVLVFSVLTVPWVFPP